MPYLHKFAPGVLLPGIFISAYRWYLCDKIRLYESVGRCTDTQTAEWVQGICTEWGNSVKRVIHDIGKGALVLVCGVILGFAALCLVHLIPVDKMYQNVATSKDAINVHQQIVGGYVSTTVDNYTDSIMLNEAICDIDTGLIDKVVNNYQANYWKGYDQQGNLMHYLDGDEGYRYQGYSHYWGGHQIFIKLMLLVGDYPDILVFNTIVQFLLVMAIMIRLQKMGKGYAILPFGIVIASMMPVTIALCMQYCTVYYVTILGSLLLLKRYEKNPHADMCLLFLMIGMATSYVDFLTYPFVSLGIPLVFWLMLEQEEKLSRKVGRLLWNSGFWCAGYIGMWAGKWILGSILSPQSGSLGMAINSILYRGSNTSTEGTVSLMDVLMKNAFVYIKKPLLAVLVCVIVFYCCKIVKNKALTAQNIKRMIPYVIVFFYPLLWYRMSENHSYEHAFMAYRELAIGLFAGLMILALLAKSDKAQPQTSCGI